MPLHPKIYNNNNRENLRLLDMSSETESDEIQTEITPASRKKIRRKRERNHGHSSTHSLHGDSSSSNTGPSSARRFLITAVAGGGLVWLITLTWLTAALNDQLSRLDYTVAQGMANGTPSLGRRCRDQLLSGSSDEQEELWVKRSRRSRPCGSAFTACSALMVCVCVIATTTVLWLFVDVRQQITSLRREMEQVSTGSEGVRDAVQQCHSTARELRANTTELAERMALLYAAHKNLSAQVLTLEGGLLEVQRRLSAAPELADAPKRLDEVRESVATLGARIDDVSARLVAAKEQAGAVSTQQDYIAGNVTLMKDTIEKLSNQSSASSLQDTNKALEPVLVKQTELQNSLQQLNSTLISVNTTLATKLAWAEQDLKDYRIKVSAMQDSIQNSSVSLLGLQAAWRQSTDEITSNITQLNHNMTDVLADISVLRQGQLHLTTLTSKLDNERDTKIDTKIVSSLSNVASPVQAENADLKTFYGNVQASQSQPLPITTQVTVAPKHETGKPNILASK